MKGGESTLYRPYYFELCRHLHTLTGVVDLTTALPSSLWVVTCTCTPGFEESWFSVGGRAGEGEAMMVDRDNNVSTVFANGEDGTQ